MSTNEFKLKRCLLLGLLFLAVIACHKDSGASGGGAESGVTLRDGVVFIKYSTVGRTRYVLGSSQEDVMSFLDHLGSVFLLTEDISVAAQWIQDHCDNKTLFSICPLWQCPSTLKALFVEMLSLDELRLLFGKDVQSRGVCPGVKELRIRPPIRALKYALPNNEVRYIFGMTSSGIALCFDSFLFSAYLITSDLSIAANWIRDHCECFSWLEFYLADTSFEPSPPPHVEALSFDEVQFLRVNSFPNK